MKVILLGDSCVGKSTLLTCVRKNQNIIPTIGVDCIVYNKMQIWDTSGHPRFKPVVEAFYSKMDVFVFVYRDMESLGNIEMIRRKVMRLKSSTPCKYIIVYNGDDKDVGIQGKMYSVMYNFKFLRGDLKKKKVSERVMNTIEKCAEASEKNRWRYCWFY